MSPKAVEGVPGIPSPAVFEAELYLVSHYVSQSRALLSL